MGDVVAFPGTAVGTLNIIELTAINSAATNRNLAKQKLAELEPVRDQCLTAITNFDMVMKALGFDPEVDYRWDVVESETGVVGYVYVVEPPPDEEATA